jgi:sec-independent protein translocase protein TatC
MREASLMEHLEELRGRLIKALLAWGVMTAGAFVYREQLLEWLKRPLDLFNVNRTVKAELVALGITEPFVVSLKIAAFGGLALALPFVVYQIWGFISPGLYAHERRLAIPFLIGAGFSFSAGVAFCYFLMLPVAVPFLLGFLGDLVTPQLSIGMYMGQILTLLGIMGLVFEMPVLAYLLAALGFLRSAFLIQHWRIAIVIMITLAAVITPTQDPVNLSIAAAPLVLLYGLSIGIVRLVEKKPQAPKTIEIESEA